MYYTAIAAIAAPPHNENENSSCLSYYSGVDDCHLNDIAELYLR